MKNITTAKQILSENVPELCKFVVLSKSLQKTIYKKQKALHYYNENIQQHKSLKILGQRPTNHMPAVTVYRRFLNILLGKGTIKKIISFYHY